MKKSDIPNILSFLRLAMVPVFITLYVKERTVWAIAVFILAGITDVLDGYIARKYNYVSNFGKILDPLADKLMQLSAFICLYTAALIPWWMPVIYFAKEALTAFGAMFIFKRSKLVVKSNVFGKAATVLVFAAVCVIAVFGRDMNVVQVDVICIIVSCYFVFSCFMYAFRELWNLKAAKDSANAAKQGGANAAKQK